MQIINHRKNPILWSGQIFLDAIFLIMSAKWPSGSKRCFYGGHDRKVDGSTPTQASSLYPWLRCFTTIISAWWNLTSSKLKKSEAKFKRKTRKQRQLLSKSAFVLSIAPPLLSSDRRIKMKKSSSINHRITKDYAKEKIRSLKCFLRIQQNKCRVGSHCLINSSQSFQVAQA